mgnify:CR=1 FL=1
MERRRKIRLKKNQLLNLINLLMKKPPAIAITKIIEKGLSSARDAIAGPGQKPTIPHPMPKSEAPKINCLSNVLMIGISKFKPNKGLVLLRKR